MDGDGEAAVREPPSERADDRRLIAGIQIGVRNSAHVHLLACILRREEVPRKKQEFLGALAVVTGFLGAKLPGVPLTSRVSSASCVADECPD